MLMADEQAQRQVDEATLRETARAIVQAGTLPNRRPDRTWAGYGVGAACTICSTPVTHDELEFEIEFAPNGDNAGENTHHVHVRCFTAWERERNDAGLSQAISSAGRDTGREDVS
jgi:hypothetical protein